jgi:ATP-dependent Lon protease
VALGLEMRRRVKEQLKRLNPIEFSRVNLSYLDKNTGDEFVAECAELGASKLIPETPLQPGDIFCVGYDPSGSRVVFFRVQTAAPAGSGKFQVVGITSKAIRESARMAFDYLRINSKKVGLDRDMGSYDFNIQVMSPMSGKDSEDLGVAFYVALVSALVNKPTAGGLVVLGQMSIHGVLSRIEQLGDRLRVAMDAGVFSRRSSPTLSEGGRVTGKDLAGGSSGWAYSYPLWHITERTPATNHAHVDTCLCPSRRCPHSRAHVRSRFIVPEGSRV